MRLDVATFQRLGAECLAHNHGSDQLCDACVEKLSAAVALYRGDFMEMAAAHDRGCTLTLQEAINRIIGAAQ